MSDAPASSGATRGGRRRFVYKAENTELVTDGYMSLKDAQDVMLEVLQEWGVGGTTDNDIDPLASKIAHALRQGTSSERDFDKVYFMEGSRKCMLSVLRLAAGKRDNSENPVRVFARSYNSGELAVRLYDMLRDPENVQIREEAALDYGCSLDVVHVSFDFADALVKFQDMRLAQIERLVIKTNTVNKVRTSRSTHIGGSEGGTVQDAQTHSASVEAAAPPQQTSVGAGVSPGNVRNRANFSAIR